MTDNNETEINETKGNEEKANWYVVHTYSSYENKVSANLEKMVENRGMEDQILEIAVPTEEYVDTNDALQNVLLLYF